MKRKLLVIFLLTASAFLIVGLLDWRSKFEMNRSAGFNRTFFNSALNCVSERSFSFTGDYIGGFSNGTIYLPHGKFFDVIFQYCLLTGDTAISRLSLKDPGFIPYGSVKVNCDSSSFLVTGPGVSDIFKGSLKDMTGSRYCRNNVLADALVLIRDSLFIVRTLDKSKGYTLRSSIPRTDTISELLTPQEDNIFSKDGELLYCPKLNKVIYVYFYRNQYLIADTSLNLAAVGKTVDTTSWAKITVSRPDKQGRIKMSSPPLLVNGHSRIDGAFLYIQSRLRADNESLKTFADSSVIDIYNLENRRYVNSFHVPKFKGKAMKDFWVADKLFIALYEQHLKIFTLPN
jgi:hypothetical protein